MRRLPLALLAAAALILLPNVLGRLRAPRTPLPDLRDALSSADWADLATIHQRAAGDTASCGWCHLESRPGAARAAASDSTRWLASLSGSAAETTPVNTALCLSCHDGRAARAVPHTLPGQRNPNVDPGGANHPVGVDYLATALSRPEAYHHPAAHPEIRLERGTVGCTSCHLGHARNGRVEGPAGLAANACLSCHNY